MQHNVINKILVVALMIGVFATCNNGAPINKNNGPTSTGGSGGPGGSGGSDPSGPPPAPNPVAVVSPQKNWRVNATQAQTSDPNGQVTLQALTSGGDAVFEPVVTSGSADPSFIIQVGAAASGGNVMLTYGGLEGISGLTVQFEQATSAQAGTAPTDGWNTVATVNPNSILEKFEFLPQPNVWYRVTLHPPASFARPGKINMVEMGLYDLGGSQPKDYWIVTGASLEVQSFLNFTWKAAIKQAFPGYDPVLFNEAQGGWYSADLLKALPGILAAHPQGKYVAIHIGGNDVNYNRPYPGGSSTLQNNLEQIVGMVQNANMIPIVARLTYRAYPSNSFPDGFPVPPSDNGSGPYVTDIYDPVIKSYCPSFYDNPNERGLVDGYDFTEQNPNYLLSDGIHFTPAGATAWENYWVQTAAKVIYSAPSAQ